MLHVVTMTMDELEALRLVDAESFSQAAAAREMGVSRPTLGRIVQSARVKTAQVLTKGWGLAIETGSSFVRPGGPAMLIAIPTDQGKLVSHWGQSPQISLYRFPSDATSPKLLSTDAGCACKSGLASVLAGEGVTHVLVGQLGEGAMNALTRHGMKVIRGVSGDPHALAAALAAGQLTDKPELCRHEDCGHDHDHDHDLSLRVR
jgi:predicted DNA-binding protein (UPF0251 family)/predicted Fe-Mo cluster-binding NifX family protein